MSSAVKRIGLGLIALQVFAGNVMAQETTPASSAAASPPSELVTAPATGLGSLPQDLTPWGMYQSADIVVKAVLLGLLFASIVTWTVGLAKGIELLSAQRRVRTAFGDLSRVRSLRDAVANLGNGGGPVPAFIKAAAAERELSDDLRGEGIKERIASRLERIEAAARQRISRGTGILATIGATAPFVGLFGTVWGIMNSFIGISRAQTTNLAIVAPGIAEALLATAFGLVAAIPAVVIYNAFARATGVYRGLLGDAAAETLRLVSRDLDREETQQGGETVTRARFKAAE